MTTLTAVDCIAKFVPNIPVDSPAIQQVNGYVTQVGTTADIQWSQADFDRFPSYIRHTIAQLPSDDPLSADIIDYEGGAATIPAVVSWVAGKHAAGEIAVVYADDANLSAIYDAISAAGETASTYWWVADWNLDEAEATALLGTVYKGLTVLGVQWASPSSNPRTLLPGTNFQLQDAGCDLSVFIPFPGSAPEPPPVSPPPTPVNWTEQLVSELPEVASGSTDAVAVERVQSNLLILGYNLGATGTWKNGVDGDFGPITKASVQHVQALAHASNAAITVDGIVGPQTWPLLLGV